MCLPLRPRAAPSPLLAAPSPHSRPPAAAAAREPAGAAPRAAAAAPRAVPPGVGPAHEDWLPGAQGHRPALHCIGAMRQRAERAGAYGRRLCPARLLTLPPTHTCSPPRAARPRASPSTPLPSPRASTVPQSSRYAHQLERFACIYTSHVSNLIFYSPLKSYRGAAGELRVRLARSRAAARRRPPAAPGSLCCAAAPARLACPQCLPRPRLPSLPLACRPHDSRGGAAGQLS